MFYLPLNQITVQPSAIIIVITGIIEVIVEAIINFIADTTVVVIEWEQFREVVDQFGNSGIMISFRQINVGIASIKTTIEYRALLRNNIFD